MSKEKDRDYCILDHANKQVDQRLRVNPNRASSRQATQCRTAASTFPSGAADFERDAPGKAD